MVSLVLGSLKNTNVNHIQRVASSIDWEFLFRGANVNKKVDILNECLKNIFHNFIPNRIIKCNYRDPPWMTDVIKSKLKEQRSYLTKHIKNIVRESLTLKS